MSSHLCEKLNRNLGGRLQDYLKVVSQAGPDVFKTFSLKPSLQRLHNVFNVSERTCHVREISFVQHAYCDYDFSFQYKPAWMSICYANKRIIFCT